MLRFAVFFSVLLVVLTGLCVYIHRRASTVLGLSRRGRLVLGGLLAAGVVASTLGRLLGGLLSDAFLRVVAAFGMTVMLAVIISAVLLAVVDLPRILVSLVARRIQSKPAVDRSVEVAAPAARAAGALEGAPAAVAGPAVNESKAEAPIASTSPAILENTAPAKPSLSRRAFVTHAAAGSAFFIGTGSAAYGAIFGRHDYVIEEVAIPIPGLPKSLDGFSIAQLSDIHIGLFVGERELNAAEELVRKARVDMVVMTGDLIDSHARYAPELGRLARRLGPLARRGVVAIPGNHDYFAGIDETLAALRGGGATVLKNSGITVGDGGGSFALLGVDDVWAARMNRGGGPNLKAALASVPLDLPRVLLCHNPVYFPEVAGDVALQLSGHTHGGQVNLVVRPADLVLPYGYVAGQYERNGSRLYINRGFGTAGPPARVQAPPEVTRVVLVAA
ncbi:MAG TPA: metallophosphoesterase [Polyangiaceae bacterium]|nr:metallophosphoesterase [Polyangiaceae bacterium]